VFETEVANSTKQFRLQQEVSARRLDVNDGLIVGLPKAGGMDASVFLVLVCRAILGRGACGCDDVLFVFVVDEILVVVCAHIEIVGFTEGERERRRWKEERGGCLFVWLVTDQRIRKASKISQTPSCEETRTMKHI
jgi:hypothetical protein